MVKAWDVENEVDEIFYTLRKRYEKECLNVSSNKVGVRKKYLNLKINSKRPVLSFKKFLD